MFADLKPDLDNSVLQTQIEEYLPYVGGAAGALVLTGVAAYYASRPAPQRPLVPLDAQAKVLPVRNQTFT